MSDISNPVVVLDEAECWRRLATQDLGRIVTRVVDVVDIFPINFVVDGESIVIRTAEGTKFAELLIGGEVLFEADEHSETDAWSVVLRGMARVLRSDAEIAAAEALPLKPMVPTVKRNYVRITPGTISGRYFEFGDEPPHDGPQLY